MNHEVLHYFKVALSGATMTNYLARRAAQGVGGAKALAGAVSGQTSRAAVKAMSPLDQHRLRGVMTGGAAVTGMNRAAANPVTQGMRQRVNTAWTQAVNQAPGVRSAKPLSPGYDYGATGMTSGPAMAYSKAHVNTMMGAGQLADPKKLMRSPVTALESAPTVASASSGAGTGVGRLANKRVSGSARTVLAPNPMVSAI